MPLFTRALADSWRGLLGWTAGISAALFLYLPLYSTISGPDMTELIDNLPKALVTTLNYGAIETGAGYTQATFFGLMGFLLVTIAATAWGASAIAGDEESGSLELTLAHGVTRVQVVIERAAAIVVKLLWLGRVSALIILLLDDSAGLGVGVKAFAGSLALVGYALNAVAAQSPDLDFLYNFSPYHWRSAASRWSMVRMPELSRCCSACRRC